MDKNEILSRQRTSSSKQLCLPACQISKTIMTTKTKKLNEETTNKRFSPVSGADREPLCPATARPAEFGNLISCLYWNSTKIRSNYMFLLLENLAIWSIAYIRTAPRSEATSATSGKFGYLINWWDVWTLLGCQINFGKLWSTGQQGPPKEYQQITIPSKNNNYKTHNGRCSQ